jgi:hypothetical protein
VKENEKEKENESFPGEYVWDSIANLLPALGRDFNVDVKPLDGDPENCKYVVVLTYFTKMGAAVTPRIAKELNTAVRTVLATRARQNGVAPSKSLNWMRLVRVSLVDGRTAYGATPPVAAQNEVPEKDAATDPDAEPAYWETDAHEEWEKKQAEKKKAAEATAQARQAPAASRAPETPEDVPEDADEASADARLSPAEKDNTPPDPYEIHRQSALQMFITNSDISGYDRFLQQILALAVTLKMNDSPANTVSMPRSVSEDWLSSLESVFGDSVVTTYGTTISPGGFRNVAEKLSENMIQASHADAVYAGTAKILVARDGSNIILTPMCLKAKETKTKKQGE